MYLRLCTFFLLLYSFLGAEAPRSPLTLDAIHNEMEKMFSEHLTQKKMNGEILKKAIMFYINQFDPRHVYLLQEEVIPYLNISRYQLERLAEDFQNQQYSIFQKINATIQASIRKMRQFRRSMVADMGYFTELSKKSLPNIAEADKGEVDTFAETQEELEERHAIYMAHMVSREINSLKALNQPVSFVAAVRNVVLELEEDENSYLYLDKFGKPLSNKEQEDMFAFHILRAMTASLDVHSQFLNPREAQKLRMKLEKAYTGVGIEVDQQGRHFIVAGLIKGSPADLSGKIEVGDELLSIGQTAVNTLTGAEVDARLDGEEGSYVDLGFSRRGSKPFHAVLERRRVTLQDGRVDTSFVNYNGGIIGVVQLHSFYQGAVSSDQDVMNAIGELEKKGKLEGLILDLRDNRGGFLMQAVKVAGLFIKTGVIVAAKYSDGSLHYFRDLDPKVRYSGPLVVLCSKETASAAEIVAEALKDYGVGIIVGDAQTYGKGSIQMQTVTGDKDADSYLKVTIGRYYGVSGYSTQLDGVKADVVVPGNLAEKKVGEEFLFGTIKSDTISPSYDDKLSDVASEDKEWYQKYYVPFLQQRSEKYRQFIPQLAKKSEERLEKNRNYQSLLHGNFVITERHGLTDKKVILDPEAALRALRNMQLQEATNITKDLIQLSLKEK